MTHTFNFRIKHSYDTTKTGITIPIELSNGPEVVQINPKLDTGASFCIFERAYAEMLGVSVEGGTPTLVSTANGSFRAFGHRLTMTALGLRFDVTVYFAADENIKRNVLGRLGFIDQLRLCLVEHDGELYVSKYDDE